MKLTLFTLFIFLMLNQNSIKCENYFEQTNGPFGGTISRFVVGKNGDIIAVTGAYGMPKVYRTTNKGKNWSFIGHDSITEIAAKSDGNFIVGKYDGVVQLYDKDLNFIKNLKDGSIYQGSISDIKISNSGKIYLNYGLYLSTDDGNSWQYEPLPYDYQNIEALDSTDGIYEFADYNMIGISTDGGKTFNKSKVFDSIGVQYHNSIQRICYDKQFNTLVVYAQTGYVYISTDSGASWTKAKDSLPITEYNSIMTVAFNGKIYFSGNNIIFQSTDGGYQWSKLTDFKTQTIYSIVPDVDHLYFLSEQDGIYDYSLMSYTLNNLDNGIKNTFIGDLCSSPNGYLYGINITNVFLSKNNGNDWERLNYQISYYNSTKRIKCDKDNNVFMLNDSGFFRSTDFGSNWLNLGFSGNFNDFKITENGRIYIAGIGLYHSDDLGYSWTKDSVPVYRIVSIDVLQNKYILAGNFSGASYFSADTGKTWEICKVGVIEQYGCHVAITKDLNLIINLDEWSSGSTCFISQDTGKTYQVLKTPNGGSQRITLLGTKDNNISISLYDPFVSEHSPNNDLMFFSNDYGNSWHLINKGLENVFDIMCMAFGNDNSLYVGTLNDGIYKCKNFTEVDNLHENVSTTLSLFPNPAGDYIEVSGFKVGAHCNEPLQQENIQIYNILGECILSISQTLNPNPQKIDVSTLPTGVYYLGAGSDGKMFVKE